MPNELFISEVDYTPENSHILQVKIESRQGQTTKQAIVSRDKIIELLDADVLVFTKSTKSQSNPQVFAYPLGEKRFIKTVKNDVTEDNLGELPAIGGTAHYRLPLEVIGSQSVDSLKSWFFAND